MNTYSLFLKNQFYFKTIKEPPKKWLFLFNFINMDLFDFLEKIVLLEGKEDEILKAITENEDTQKFIIQTIQDQLFNSGEDGLGNSLGSYKPFTIQYKKAKNQPFDRITLKDTGDFYSSYYVKSVLGGFIIDASRPEKDVINLFDRYGEDIIQPNEDSLEKIREYYNERIIEYLESLF
jgi:hypothetical protein